MDTTHTEVAAKTLQVLIVDDHPTIREGLKHFISLQPDMAVCGQAADAAEALQQVAELRPDVVVVDLRLKTSDGLELVKSLKIRHKHVRTLVHSMYDEAVYAERSLHAGAMGFISKDADPAELMRAIREIGAGRIFLSPAMANTMLGRAVGGAVPQADPVDALTDRQFEVFRLIGEGQTVPQIAKRLHVSPHTVETHRENIKQKLNIGTVSELTRRAVLWVAAMR